MSNRIEDYALLSDTQSAALVGRDGSIDWLTFPRFDSPACFAMLVGTPDNGRWLLAPADEVRTVERRYRPGTLVLETRFTTDNGVVEIIDCMPVRADHRLDLVRLVRGVSGRVPMKLHLTVRMDYGSIVPWVTSIEGGLRMVAGPDALTFCAPVDLRPEGWSTVADFTVAEGEEVPFDMAWSESHAPPPGAVDVPTLIERTTSWWQEWSERCATFAPYDDAIRGSLTVLKGLTYAPTGALMAASTTSLPETPAGVRNWDYRYAWVRDSTFALWGLHTLGLDREANNFFHFLADAALDENGEAHSLQVMYGVGGEKTLTEFELDHLSGYDGAKPVRVGNGAYVQSQHDVWGAMLDSVYLHVRSRDEQLAEQLWPMLKKQVEQAIANWKLPDRGIWEVRGEPQHFVSSKMFCWVALDRGVKLALLHGEKDYARQWTAIAEEIKADILANGLDERGVFTQRYGNDALDASVLLIPLLRFLPPDDSRVKATVLAIADELTIDGLVLRYKVAETDDGLVGEEGTFTICSFWLVSALVEIGELKRAKQLCERLLAFASPLRLYAEEIDTRTGRHLGNFPQAFTHLALINAVVHVIRAEEDIAAGEFRPAY